MIRSLSDPRVIIEHEFESRVLLPQEPRPPHPRVEDFPGQHRPDQHRPGQHRRS